MSVRVRLATLEDRDTIAHAEGVIFGPDAWSEATVEDELAHPHSHYLIAEDGDDMVGYAGVRLGPPGGQGDIQTIAVVAQARGQGLGGQLLDALLAKAWAAQLAEVFLEVRADNHSAQSLYLSRGFREIARRPGYYQPDGVDAIVMVRESNPSDLQGGRL